MKSILIIDDDSGVLETYQMALEAEGYQVWTAGMGPRASNSRGRSFRI